VSPSQNLSVGIASPSPPAPSHRHVVYTKQYPEGSHFIRSDSASSHYSRSPEIFSPVGLPDLPIISPLASSPVDVREYQGLAVVPGVQELTFESPKSPLDIALDTKLPDSPSIESLTSSRHNLTTITSPQDPNWDQQFREDILAVKLPDSPTSEHALSPQQRSPPAPYDHIRGDSELGAVLVCGSMLLTSMIAKSTEGRTGHVDPFQTPVASPTATGLPEEDICPPSPEISGTPPYPRLHCRLCQSDPCVDLTATMCGHIFCYKYV
jgi:hypothetical protein